MPTSTRALNTEVMMLTFGSKRLNMQVRLISYNTISPRILWEIKSDGPSSVDNNFTASTERNTVKGVNNLKSDILEKYFETTSKLNQWVQWDTGAGRVISLDTFALIAHNITNSAVVTLKGFGAAEDAAPADDAAWDALPVYATLTMPEDPDERNLIWVSPHLPTVQYRHWRVYVTDPTNSVDYIRIGRLLAGSALIFSGESCLDEIEASDVSYKDELQLNGYTRIANNRALKRNLVITFKDLNKNGRANYRLLKRYLRYCRDTMKALFILDPSDEVSKYDYTIFAKLRSMPRETHRYIDRDASYTSMALEYDEAR